MSETPAARPGLLLHICCAPDATATAERLAPDFAVTGFFHNPNIHPETEYQRRLDAARQAAEALGFPLEVPEYRPGAWLEQVRGLEQEPEGGERCQRCFAWNLTATARRARELGLPWFTTTLTISPHKRSDRILALGRALGEAHGVRFLEADFKKKDGFKRSLEWSRALGLYRQRYCGCQFSMREGAHA